MFKISAQEILEEKILDMAWFPIDLVRHRASLIAQLVKNPPALQETLVWFLVGKMPWRKDRLTNPEVWGFPCGSAGKESTCNVGDLCSIPGLGRFPGEGNDYPPTLVFLPGEFHVLYSPWGLKVSDTLSNFHFHLVRHSSKLRIFFCCHVHIIFKTAFALGILVKQR